MGPHLVKHLISNGFEVFGIDRSGKKKMDGCVVDSCDVTDYKALFAIIERVKPDFIFHLAGQSSVASSWGNPELTMKINVGGTKNLLAAVAAAKIDPKILIVSSAEVYGIPKKVPIDEQHPLYPISPYGESKLEQEKLALQYSHDGIKIVIVRSFNQTGPGQPSDFVCSDFARQVAEVEKGVRQVINVGDIAVSRDFTDVRDAVAAYLLALQKCKPGQTYNICAGMEYKIRDVIEKLVSFSPAAARAGIVKDAARLRKSDIPVLLGNPAKFMAATGWKPTIPFEQTLRELLDFWRTQQA